MFIVAQSVIWLMSVETDSVRGPSSKPEPHVVEAAVRRGDQAELRVVVLGLDAHDGAAGVFLDVALVEAREDAIDEPGVLVESHCIGLLVPVAVEVQEAGLLDEEVHGSIRRW
jgi:hypothetical protein